MTILVSGDAGIGKTRLTEELSVRARERGQLVVNGASSPLAGEGVPYAAMVGVLRHLARQAGADLLRHAAGPALTAELSWLLPSLGEPAASPSKARLFEAALTALAGVAMADPNHPLVVILEDLHWADIGTVELVDFLARNLTDEPIALVATFRADELPLADSRHLVLAELSRHPRAVSIELAGLGREDVAALVADLVGDTPAPSQVEAILRRSGGNPFFVEQLALAASDDVPAELQRLTLARVEQLPRDARTALDVASVVGNAMDHDVLERVAAAHGIESRLLEVALDALVGAQLLQAAGDGYRFRHDLTREAVYGALLPGERRRLHAEVASAIGARLPDGDRRQSAMELARHWWEAAEWAPALTAALDAATHAEAVLAAAEAHVQLERALAAWDKLSSTSDPDEQRAGVTRLDLMERTAEAAYWADAPERAIELAEQALALIDVTAEPQQAALWLARVGRAATNTGELDRALAAFDRAATLLPGDKPSAVRARVLAESARLLMMISQYGEGLARAREALAEARAAGARAEEAHAIITAGASSAGLGRISEGIELVAQGLDIAKELRSAEGFNRVYGNLTGMTLVGGRLEESAELIREGLVLTEGLDGAGLGTAATNSARALVRLGRWDDAEDLLHGFPGPTPQFSGCAQLCFAAIHIRRGNLNEAEAALAIADERTAGFPDVLVRGWYLVTAAELAVEQDRPLDAFADIEQALLLEAGTDELFAGPELRAYGIRALADAAAHARLGRVRPDLDAAKARIIAAQMVEGAASLVAAWDAKAADPSPEPATFALQCRAEASRLDTSDADLWQQVWARWDELGFPYHRAYCQWREAEARFEARSGRARAVEALLAAWSTSRALGAGTLAAKIERLAQRARVDLTLADAGDVGPADADPATRIASDLGLTRREVEVLRCLAFGRSDRQIADELFISKKTVSVHVSNLLRKLDAVNRVQAGEIGQRAGLV